MDGAWVAGGWIWFIHNWVINHTSFSMDGELVGSLQIMILFQLQKHQTQECQLPNTLIRTCSQNSKRREGGSGDERTLALNMRQLNLLNLVNGGDSKWAWKKLPYCDSLIDKQALTPKFLPQISSFKLVIAFQSFITTLSLYGSSTSTSTTLTHSPMTHPPFLSY